MEIFFIPCNGNLAAARQNQQNDMYAQQKTRISLNIRLVWYRVFAVRMRKSCVLIYPLSTQQIHWSDELIDIFNILKYFIFLKYISR